MSTKHEKSFVNFEHGYETNVIGLRGIIYFAVGLFLLIVITFGLMYFLVNVMSDQDAKAKASNNPMAMDARESLPPEPRLQAAPGFGVDSENGRVNLELKTPQSEYWELERQWEKQWREGQKNGDTVVSLPTEEAKKKLLEESVKTRQGEETQKILVESQHFPAYSSAGRTVSDQRR